MTVIDEPPAGGGGGPVDSIREQILQAVTTALNTGAPTGYPAFERDRWVDVDEPSCPWYGVAGFLDEPVPDQQRDLPIDRRVCTISGEMFVKKGASQTASQAADGLLQWIQSQVCGVPAPGSDLADLVHRIRLGKVVAGVLKGDTCRCVFELLADYQVLVTDATKRA